MKIITLEEHFETATIRAAQQKLLPPREAEQLKHAPGASGELMTKLLDLDQVRLQQMDRAGIDMQIISYSAPGTQILPASEAVPLTKDANDQLAEAVKKHPDRFAGFAALPTPDPEAAAAELERAVQQLSFKGAMINGRTNDLFLDDPSFRPILETAEKLDVPIYLHPTIPPQSVQDAYYSNLDPAIGGALTTAAWGWHMETGLHALRMIIGGVFDRYPRLQVILGHWGEMVPYYLARTSQVLAPVTPFLQRSVADYFRDNFYVTPSGMFTWPPFQLCLQIVGADRIMYAVDYPYLAADRARSFLEGASISPADKKKIAYGNAARLFQLAL